MQFPRIVAPQSVDCRSKYIKTDTQAGPQTLYIYTTEQGLTSPTGVSNFLSGFAANAFTGSIDFVKEFTYVDAGNGLYARNAARKRHVHDGTFFDIVG